MQKVFSDLIVLLLAFLGIMSNAYGDLGDFNFTSHWLQNDLTNRMYDLGKLQRKIKEREAAMNGKTVEDDEDEDEYDDDDDEEEPSNTGNVEFRYDPKLSPIARQQAIDAMVEIGRKTGKMDAAGEKLLNKAFGNIDIMKTIGAALQKKGHSPHSLATAVGYWLVSHMQVAQNTDFTDQQLTAVVKQVEQQLRKTKMPDDAEKQMAAEHLLWTATFQLLSYQDVRKTGTKQEQKTIAEVSRVMLRQQFGMDAEKMTITDKGLVSR